jgi:GTPase SAR1 family protein
VRAAAQRGTRELLAYLRSLKEGEPLYEAKLVLVGEGEVGKTCLVAAMKGEKFIKDRPTTHGIEINTLELPHPKLDKTLTLNAWDFGGQPVYRVTHQFFFSRRSLYLLLWSPRMGVEQCDVEGWIKRIKLRIGPEARIIIVATHSKTEGRIARIDERQLRRDYGDMIVDFHEVDSGVNVDPVDKDPAGEKVGVEELKVKIAEAAAKLSQMGEMFSVRWKAARDEVLAMKNPRVTYNRFADICKKHELDEVATETLADLMHDLGHAVYYGDDQGLKDEMILQPEWLTKAIGFVLEDQETNKRSGELAHARLWGIWYGHGVEKRQRYEPLLHPFFLRLMEKYDVSYRLQDEQTSLVAQLVPNVRPDDLPWDADASAPGGEGQVSLVCQMDAEPPGLVPWMIVRTHHFATDPRRH